MTAFWNVPYVGQVGSGANEHGNDCGPTSVAMVLRFFGIEIPTVDALFNEVQSSGDGYTSFGDLCKLLDARGIDTDYDAGISNGQLYEYLTRGTPVIALIRYGALSSIRPNRFTGSHFCVVTGCDLDTVYVHDPLNTPTTGEGIKVPLATWASAWGTLGDNNPDRSLLIPKKVTTAPSVLRVVFPKDSNGCNVRSVAGGVGETTRLYGIPFDPTFNKTTSRMQVYEFKTLERSYDRNWGRIHPTEQRWVCLDYTVEA